MGLGIKGPSFPILILVRPNQDSPTLFLYGVYLHFNLIEPRPATMSIFVRLETTITVPSNVYSRNRKSRLSFIHQGILMEGHNSSIVTSFSSDPGIFRDRFQLLSKPIDPLIGFFNVDFDFSVFLRIQAIGLQVKFFYGSLLSLATSILCYILVILVF